MQKIKILAGLLALCIVLCCGDKMPKEKKKIPGKDSTNITTKPTVDKSYLKKRPEEFKEFFFLTAVIPFTGRVATAKDVKTGAAVFNMDSKKDSTHKALNIRLPFYAFLLQPGNKPSKFVAVVQAETLRSDTILGYKEANGLFGICRPRELEYFESQINSTYSTIR